MIIYKNSLMRKIRLISKFKTSQPGKQTIEIQIMTNIWRNKGNRAMRFSQLIEYNTRNISGKIMHKIWRENYFTSLFKNQNWANLYINSLSIYAVCFHWMPSWGLSKYTENKLQTTCFYVIWPSYYMTTFHSLVAFTSWDIGHGL